MPEIRRRYAERDPGRSWWVYAGRWVRNRPRWVAMKVRLRWRRLRWALRKSRNIDQ